MGCVTRGRRQRLEAWQEDYALPLFVFGGIFVPYAVLGILMLLGIGRGGCPSCP